MNLCILDYSPWWIQSGIRGQVLHFSLFESHHHPTGCCITHHKLPSYFHQRVLPNSICSRRCSCSIRILILVMVNGLAGLFFCFFGISHRDGFALNLSNIFSINSPSQDTADSLTMPKGMAEFSLPEPTEEAAHTFSFSLSQILMRRDPPLIYGSVLLERGFRGRYPANSSK